MEIVLAFITRNVTVPEYCAQKMTIAMLIHP